MRVFIFTKKGNSSNDTIVNSLREIMMYNELDYTTKIKLENNLKDQFSSYIEQLDGQKQLMILLQKAKLGYSKNKNTDNNNRLNQEYSFYEENKDEINPFSEDFYVLSTAPFFG